MKLKKSDITILKYFGYAGLLLLVIYFYTQLVNMFGKMWTGLLGIGMNEQESANAEYIKGLEDNIDSNNFTISDHRTRANNIENAGSGLGTAEGDFLANLVKQEYSDRVRSSVNGSNDIEANDIFFPIYELFIKPDPPTYLEIFMQYEDYLALSNDDYLKIYTEYGVRSKGAVNIEHFSLLQLANYEDKDGQLDEVVKYIFKTKLNINV